MDGNSPTHLYTSEALNVLQEEQAIFDNVRSITIKSGEDAQKSRALQNLPDLVKDHQTECFSRIVPKIQESVAGSAEVQEAAGEAFVKILRNDFLPVQKYAQTFLVSIIEGLDSRDRDVAEAWLNTLLDVSELLPIDTLHCQILPLAKSKSDLSHTVHQREMACSIIGKIVARLDQYTIQREVMPVVQGLCQDVDYEVRARMCSQLTSIASAIGLKLTKKLIIRELVELANDEKVEVQLSALTGVAELLSLLDDESCNNIIRPLVRRCCQSALATNTAMLPAVAKHFGKLCHSLSVNFSAEDRLWYFDYFKTLCTLGCSAHTSAHEKSSSSGGGAKNHSENLSNLIAEFSIDSSSNDLLHRDIEIRANAAYNFPGILLTGLVEWKQIEPTLQSLCSDPSPAVRKNIAAGMHEICKLAGGAHLPVLIKQISILLHDHAIEVLQPLITHLHSLLSWMPCKLYPQLLTISDRIVLLNSPGATQNTGVERLVSAMLSCEELLSSSLQWRIHEELLLSFAALSHMCPSNTLQSKIIPRLQNRMLKSRQLPVRLAAVRSLLSLERYVIKREHRHEIEDALKRDLQKSSSCYKRALFVDSCHMIADLYSSSFFKRHFWSAILQLADDRVANIRIKFCKFLPRLKRMINFPEDKALLQQIEAIIHGKMLYETDRDVADIMRHMVLQMDNIELRTEMVRCRLPDEADDQRKSAEEKLLIEIEERLKREQPTSTQTRSIFGRTVPTSSSSASGVPIPRSGSLPSRGTSGRRGIGRAVSSQRPPTPALRRRTTASSEPNSSCKSTPGVDGAPTADPTEKTEAITRRSSLPCPATAEASRPHRTVNTTLRTSTSKKKPPIVTSTKPPVNHGNQARNKPAGESRIPSSIAGARIRGKSYASDAKARSTLTK